MVNYTIILLIYHLPDGRIEVKVVYIQHPVMCEILKDRWHVK